MVSRLKGKKTPPPIIAFRVADSRYPLFDGTGAMLSGGRWNSQGRPLIYASMSQAGAMLEILAHSGIGKIPIFHKLVTIKIPGHLKIEMCSTDNISAWNHRNQEASRRFGDNWIESRRSLGLIVPSVIALHDKHILINPQHPEFSLITASVPEEIEWDSRLFE